MGIGIVCGYAEHAEEFGGDGFEAVVGGLGDVLWLDEECAWSAVSRNEILDGVLEVFVEGAEQELVGNAGEEFVAEVEGIGAGMFDQRIADLVIKFTDVMIGFDVGERGAADRS